MLSDVFLAKKIPQTVFLYMILSKKYNNSKMSNFAILTLKD